MKYGNGRCCPGFFRCCKRNEKWGEEKKDIWHKVEIRVWTSSNYLERLFGGHVALHIPQYKIWPERYISFGYDRRVIQDEYVRVRENGAQPPPIPQVPENQATGEQKEAWRTRKAWEKRFKSYIQLHALTLNAFPKKFYKMLPDGKDEIDRGQDSSNFESYPLYSLDIEAMHKKIDALLGPEFDSHIRHLNINNQPQLHSYTGTNGGPVHNQPRMVQDMFQMDIKDGRSDPPTDQKLHWMKYGDCCNSREYNCSTLAYTILKSGGIHQLTDYGLKVSSACSILLRLVLLGITVGLVLYFIDFKKNNDTRPFSSDLERIGTVLIPFGIILSCLAVDKCVDSSNRVFRAFSGIDPITAPVGIRELAKRAAKEEEKHYAHQADIPLAQQPFIPNI